MDSAASATLPAVVEHVKVPECRSPSEVSNAQALLPLPISSSYSAHAQPANDPPATLSTYNSYPLLPVSSTGAALPLTMEDFLNLDSFDSAAQQQQQQTQQPVLVAGQDDTNGMSFTELFQQ